jgi:hypothetical protein
MAADSGEEFFELVGHVFVFSGVAQLLEQVSCGAS